ncbi:MAG TPA: hypothetical protein VHH34_08585, partial [Pseudonocardiaceae bacterium]|nr:hypothetical protein [Pseudonocardiaceae bacterium]
MGRNEKLNHRTPPGVRLGRSATTWAAFRVPPPAGCVHSSLTASIWEYDDDRSRALRPTSTPASAGHQ